LFDAEDLFGGAEAGVGDVCEGEAAEEAVLAVEDEVGADAGFACETVGAGDVSLAGTEEVKESVGVSCRVLGEDDPAEGSESRKVMARSVVDMSTGGALVICMILPQAAIEVASHLSAGIAHTFRSVV
jgi:hypothetical protein